MDAGPDSRFDCWVPVQKSKTQPHQCKILGRVLFPRLQPWQQRRQAKLVVTVLLVAVGFTCRVGGLMFLLNRSR